MSLYALIVVALAIGTVATALYTRRQYDRGHLLVRAAMRVAVFAIRRTWWVVVYVYDYRSVGEHWYATGKARRIWRAGRLPATTDTTDGPTRRKHLPGRVVQAETVPAGLRLKVRLPGGWTASDLKPEVVASGTRRSIDARIEPHPHGGPETILVTLLRRDTLKSVVDAPIPMPGVVEIGVGENGELVRLDLATSNLAVGGQTRAGKSNLLHLVIGAVAADPRATLVLLDGKHIELAAWKDRSRNLIGADPAAALTAVRWVEADMRRRYEHIGRHGKRKASDLADDAQPGPLLLLVDEITTYTDDPEHGKAIVGVLLQIARQGLAADVHLCVATQKATGDSLPTTLRDLCETRVAFSCSTREMGEAILGRGQGDLAAKLTSGPEHRGRCIVSHPDGSIVYARAWLASDAWLGRVAGSSRPSATPIETAPAPAPRSGAGAAPRTRADDETTPRASTHASSADTRTRRSDPTGGTREQRKRRNRAAHERQRAAWLDGHGSKPAPLDEDDPTCSHTGLVVVGGVERREES